MGGGLGIGGGGGGESGLRPEDACESRSGGRDSAKRLTILNIS